MQKDYQKLIVYLCDFLEKEVQKRGFKKVVYGLSGGLDKRGRWGAVSKSF